MVYREFKDIHKDKKIIVCGCGISLNELLNPNEYITIAVNDAGRYTFEKDGNIKHFSPNYLVVLNDKSSFKAGRWEWVEKSQSPYIFTHIKGLGVAEEKKVLLQLGRYGGCDLDKEPVDYTSNSTYVACIIAAYMGCTKIGIIGVDFTNNHFFENTGEHTLAKKISVINQEYMLLKQAMDRKGIELVNLSSSSRVNLPKQAIAEF